MSGINITVYDGKSAQLAAQRAEAAAASAKQSADQATSQLMDPIAPGTEQNPTVLPDGPEGEVRRIEDVLPGHYIWGNTPFSVPEGSFGTFYWLRTYWSLTTQELPAAPPVTKQDIQQFAYTKDEYVPQVFTETSIISALSVDNV